MIHIVENLGKLERRVKIFLLKKTVQKGIDLCIPQIAKMSIY